MPASRGLAFALFSLAILLVPSTANAAVTCSWSGTVNSSHTIAAIASTFSDPDLARALNDTGHSSCHDGSGTVISCTSPSAADDGRFGRDAAEAAGILKKAGGGLAGFDYTKVANNGKDLSGSAVSGMGANDWACTRDNVTGLVWEVKTNDRNDLRYYGHSFTWYDTNAAENGGNAGHDGARLGTCDPSRDCNTRSYAAAVNASALCSYTDWRLPTPRELRSLVNYSLGRSGHFDPTYFTFPPQNVQPDPHYWTSFSYAANPADVWVVEIGGEGAGDGGAEGHHHEKTGNRQILLVRGTPPPTAGGCSAGNGRGDVPVSTPTSDFVDNGNGTVTHLATGLTWKKCPEGLSGSDCATGSAMTVTWSNALTIADDSMAAGFSDWRLPNVKELHSIVETCGYDPAINQDMFPNTPRPVFGSVFWTSTTDLVDPSSAWLLLFERGGAVTTPKGSRLFVRLVRGGQPHDSFDAKAPHSGSRRRAVRH